MGPILGSLNPIKTYGPAPVPLTRVAGEPFTIKSLGLTPFTGSLNSELSAVTLIIPKISFSLSVSFGNVVMKGSNLKEFCEIILGGVVSTTIPCGGRVLWSIANSGMDGKNLLLDTLSINLWKRQNIGSFGEVDVLRISPFFPPTSP